MHEDVVSSFSWRDKAVPFAAAEWLHCPCYERIAHRAIGPGEEKLLFTKSD